MLPLHKNPILYRELRSRLRPSKLVTLAIAVLGFLALAFTYIVMMDLNETGRMALVDWTRIWGRFSVAVMVLQVFCGFYVALGSTANSISREKVGRTYDFLTTLPTGAADKAIGLALGTNLYSLVILLGTAPLGSAAGWAGGHPLAHLLWFYALIGAAFLTVSMLGVAMGSGLAGGLLGWLVVLLVLMVDLGMVGVVRDHHFAAAPLLTLTPYTVLSALLTPTKHLATIFLPGQYHFYSWVVPWQICPLAFLALLWVLGFALASKKLSRPSNPSLHRAGVFAAFVVCQVLLLGFLSDTLTQAERPALAAGVFFVLNFVFLVAWAMTAQPPYAGLMAWAGRKPHWSGRLVSESVTSILSPNIFTGALMWIVVVAAAWAMDRIYWEYLPWERILVIGAILLMFLLAYQLLYTAGCVGSRRNGRSLGIILVAVCVVVPVIFSTLEGREKLLNATPLALFGETHELLDPGTPWLQAPTLWWSLWFAAGELVLFGALCLVGLAGLARRAPRHALPQSFAAEVGSG